MGCVGDRAPRSGHDPDGRLPSVPADGAIGCVSPDTQCDAVAREGETGTVRRLAGRIDRGVLQVPGGSVHLVERMELGCRSEIDCGRRNA